MHAVSIPLFESSTMRRLVEGGSWSSASKSAASDDGAPLNPVMSASVMGASAGDDSGHRWLW